MTWNYGAADVCMVGEEDYAKCGQGEGGCKNCVFADVLWMIPYEILYKTDVITI